MKMVMMMMMMKMMNDDDDDDENSYHLRHPALSRRMTTSCPL